MVIFSNVLVTEEAFAKTLLKLTSHTHVLSLLCCDVRVRLLYYL